MGSCADKCSRPQELNVCSASIGDKSDKEPGRGLQNFCTVAGVFGDVARAEACAALGADGEWELDPISVTPCLFSTCQATSSCSGVCASGKCFSVPGNGAVCRRKKFSGDPGICCLQDYNCSRSDSGACFSDSAQKFACADGRNGAPNHRDSTSPDCKDAIFDYCTGADLPDTSTAWFDRWTSGTCSRGLSRNLYNTYSGPGFSTCISAPAPPPGSPCNVSPAGLTSDGFYWGQSLIHRVLQKYQQQGFVLGAAPNQRGYSPLQDYLYRNVCCPYPGLCQGGLGSACAGRTLAQLSANPSAADWCGCHLSPDQYESYFAEFGVQPTCTPTCNRSTSLPLVGANQDPIACDQNVCILDGITANLVSSSGTGNVNFANICAGCVPGTCTCTLSNASTTLINETLSNANIDYVSACVNVTSSLHNTANFGPSLLPDPSPSLASVQKRQLSFASQRNVMVAVGFTLFLLILLLLVLFLCPRRSPAAPAPAAPVLAAPVLAASAPAAPAPAASASAASVSAASVSGPLPRSVARHVPLPNSILAPLRV